MDAPPLLLDRLWHTPPNPTVALPLCPVVLVLAEIHNNPPLGGAIIERIRHVNPDVTRITVDHPFSLWTSPAGMSRSTTSAAILTTKWSGLESVSTPIWQLTIKQPLVTIGHRVHLEIPLPLLVLWPPAHSDCTP